MAFTLILSSGAKAQATRTWVSGGGSDANPCSRTAPCKTFAGAIRKTAINGEINCLDPAGYGAVTITKSITIDCEDTQGSILNTGTTGLTINLGASDIAKTVRLRGLSINGSGSDGITGLRGIQVIIFVAGTFIPFPLARPGFFELLASVCKQLSSLLHPKGRIRNFRIGPSCNGSAR